MVMVVQFGLFSHILYLLQEYYIYKYAGLYEEVRF